VFILSLGQADLLSEWVEETDRPVHFCELFKLELDF